MFYKLTGRKPLYRISGDEEGVVSSIMGPASLHRRLLALGVTAGTAISKAVTEGTGKKDSPVPFRVGKTTVYLPEDVVRSIRVDTAPVNQPASFCASCDAAVS